jgi:transcriptional regulator with XRE-family HTH domain
MSPAEAGLPATGRRRTPGLRREEVAALAGLSITWYTYLEQGRGHDVSPAVLDSVARVLHLSEDERRYMHHLAFGYVVDPRPLHEEVVVSELQKEIVAIAEAHPYPVYMADHAANLVAWNSACEDWYDDWGKLGAFDRNIVKWMLTSPKAKKVLVDWEAVAHDTVARWRGDIAKYPADKLISDRVTYLLDNSKEFAQWWGEQKVREHVSVVRRMFHPRIGVLPFRIIPMTSYHDRAPLILYHFPDRE